MQLIKKNIQFIRILLVVFLLIAILFVVRFFITFSAPSITPEWNGVAATSFASGTGTEANPYIISNAAQFAYFKNLLEGSNASNYLNRYYKITNSFNYGNYTISINNRSAFTGVLDGDGHTIENATIATSLFTTVSNATIKNIHFSYINYTLASGTGGLIARTSTSSNYEMILMESDINITNTSGFGGFIYQDTESNISQVVVNNNYINNSSTSYTYSFIYNAARTTINNVLLKTERYNAIRTNNNTTTNNLTYFSIVGDKVSLQTLDSMDDFQGTEYEIILNKGKFLLKSVSDEIPTDEIPTVNYQEHASGIENNTVYVNDLISDYNYYSGYNYASSSGTTIPTGENRNVYNSNNLVKVMISYSGIETVGNTTLEGTISDTESENKMVYYKYIPVENNQITITLIENPFTNRPNRMGFNNWISDIPGVTLSFDRTLNERYATVSVTPKNGGGYEDVALSFHADWINARIGHALSSSWTYAFNNLYAAGLHEINPQETVYNFFSMRGYLIPKTAARNERYTGYYLLNNTVTNGTTTCTNRNGCTYYVPITNDEDWIPNKEYYYVASNNRSFTEVTQSYLQNLGLTSSTVNYFTSQTNMAGYYASVTFSYGASYTGYYNASGVLQSGTCSNNSCTYYELLQSFDANGNINYYDSDKTYYYYVTRDTNLVYLGEDLSSNWGSTYTKPFTFTALKNGTKLNYTWNVNSFNVTLYGDTTIENMNITSNRAYNTTDATTGSYSIVNANWHNLRIGRGLTQSENYTSFNGFVGGNAATGSSNTNTRYKMIIESGFYSSGSMSMDNSGSNPNLYIEAHGIYGNDYDRVNEDNNNLILHETASASFGGIMRSNADFGVDLVVKSGSFGNGKYDMYAGIYAGGINRGTHYVPNRIKVEGGYIYNLIGGPTSDGSSRDKNQIFIYQTGGEIDLIIGGAGYSPTYGNRIISITGGKVNYSVFGGSNGYGNASGTSDGRLNGSSFIYIGGNATIGDDTLLSQTPVPTIFGAEPGSVFGNGNGKASTGNTDYSGIGSNINAYIIIDGQSTVKNSVYGGGNYGTAGRASNSGTSLTDIKIKGGTINQNVYGGGNQSGAGYTNITATTNITMTGGSVLGNIYGGSNVSGIVYGASNVSILDGTVSGNIYGGGKGNSTFIRTNSNVVIGSTTVNKPEITGNVYGGSAFGTVNSTTSNGTSYGNTSVTVNNGVITGSVFGGGEGSTTYTPYVRGNITVTINNGDITNVFGGNDQAGTHSYTNQVYLNGGIIENAFGGGNRSSVTTTNVFLQGATVSNLYGGSNLLGDVTTSNVSLTSGTVATVFGGNDEGGSCATTNVTVNGASVTSALYGGGNNVATTTSNITLTSANGTIPNVYGGGNNAGVTTTNINQNGTTVTNMFGGSNSSGSVNNSYITHNSGTTTNLYGGNNAGGNTITSTINYLGGNSSFVYGGGYQANSSTSNITVTNGTISYIFGGGNRAGVTTANVIVNNGTIDYVYGGSNNSGIVTNPHITINNTGRKIYSIFGGGNQAQVQQTDIVFNNGTVDNIYGGGNYAAVNGNTSLDINGGVVNNNIYGGGNQGIVQGNSNVTITNGTILGSAYAGGNGAPATLRGSTNITIDGNTVIGTTSSISPTSGCVFGGGNQAYTGLSTLNNSTSTVNIVGATIYGNVYGGANTSVIYGNTVVNIGRDAVNNNNLTSGNIYVRGHIFGGGEANASGSEIYDWDYISVTQGTNINIDANGHTNYEIDGSFYGGGNASSSSGDSYLSIKNYGTRNNPEHNVSIQRVTYATLDNSSMLLAGAIDRANEFNDELFSISRVDYLTLKNNSEMYFKTGANLLKNFHSYNANGSPATVTINSDTGVITKSTDNRIYMYEGKNLNIANDQQVTDYGSVVGMTFFGLFNADDHDNIYIGLYKPSYQNGDTISWSDAIFTKGSYVLGKHETNHDITRNGFYSNFMDEETQINEVKYIEPTPASAKFYMWFIGENVVEYNVSLEASKYSTLGSVELSFYEFSAPNTSFQILGVDTSEVETGVSLVDKSSIPRIASVQSNADNIFGLGLESSNSGWLTSGKTSFYTSDPYMSGTTYYEGENTTTVPTMLFYLYHSKNISVEKDLGTVRITVMAITKINALSSEGKRLVINVDMSTVLHQGNEYEGAMTPGDKYELFASTSNNITAKSKLSAYYSLYAEGTNVYRTGYHRVLLSSFVFPENTKITMLEFVNGVPNYYYHIITSSDVTAANAEYQLYNECSYPLSLFTKMGSKSTTENYDDSIANSINYDGNNSIEEFIFIVDFADSNIQTDQLNKTLFMEMRDADDQTIIHFLGIERDQLTYNLYTGYDSVIATDITESENPLYVGYQEIFDVLVDYQSSTLGGTTVVDTQYFDSKLGVEITIFDNEGNIVSGTDLMGSYFEVDGVRYYPNLDGITHIKLSDRVGNVEKWLIFHTENSSIVTGEYTFNFETFASPDGIYYSRGQTDEFSIDIMIINSNYGLNPQLNNDSVVFNSINDKNLKFTVNYTSLLDNPNIRVSLYRRKYDTVYDTNYELVDLSDYLYSNLSPSSNEFEYYLTRNPRSETTFNIRLNSELLTGTYRLAFRLYDDNTMIGEVIRYIIIK